jgi:methionine biosynthesis protein MetW
LTVYGELVGRHGLAESHRLILESVPDGSRVLDVGCAEGYLMTALRERGCDVVGMEASEAAAAEADGEVVVGDVEDPAVRERVQGGFDVAVFGDVLEHLRDPLDVLRWAPADRVVVSLPNIAHWTARRALARGRWPREDHGLFDRTHLHFFTRTTARELVERAGFAVEHEAFAPAPLPLESRVPALARVTPALVRARPELFALQIVLRCARGEAR